MSGLRMALASSIWLSLAALCAGAQPNITFDVSEPSHAFLGFGTQIWAGDLSVEPVLRDLNVRYVRIGLGHFSGRLEVDGWGDADHEACFEGEPWKGHKETWTLLKRYDIQAIYNVFGTPENWLIGKPRKNTLNPDYYEHYAKRLAAALASMHRNAIRPKGIEIFNEPDGTWNCYVPPEGYKQIVKLLRHELNKRELHQLLIFGPGLAHIDTGNKDPWIEALDQEAADMIGAWSIHGYQWNKTHNQDPAYARDSYQQGFDRSLLKKDPERRKPVFITEFAPYKLYENENDAIELPGFPARAVEDALSFLNCGAGAVLFWEAADMSWSPDRHHGLIRLDKTPRPVFLAFQTIVEDLPVGARILKAPDLAGGDVYASAFVKGKRVLVALVNNSEAPRTRSIRIAGLHSPITPVRVRVFENKTIEDKTVEMTDTRTFSIQIPAQGVAAILLETKPEEMSL